MSIKARRAWIGAFIHNLYWIPVSQWRKCNRRLAGRVVGPKMVRRRIVLRFGRNSRFCDFFSKKVG